jgi:hypothetical protein
MDRRRADEGVRGDERPGARRRSERDAGRGAVHSFVEIAELRRIMGRLTAIEMLRLLLAGDAPSYGA